MCHPFVLSCLTLCIFLLSMCFYTIMWWNFRKHTKSSYYDVFCSHYWDSSKFHRYGNTKIHECFANKKVGQNQLSRHLSLFLYWMTVKYFWNCSKTKWSYFGQCRCIEYIGLIFSSWLISAIFRLSNVIRKMCLNQICKQPLFCTNISRSSFLFNCCTVD